MNFTDSPELAGTPAPALATSNIPLPGPARYFILHDANGNTAVLHGEGGSANWRNPSGEHDSFSLWLNNVLRTDVNLMEKANSDAVLARFGLTEGPAPEKVPEPVKETDAQRRAREKAEKEAAEKAEKEAAEKASQVPPAARS